MVEDHVGLGVVLEVAVRLPQLVGLHAAGPGLRKELESVLVGVEPAPAGHERNLAEAVAVVLDQLSQELEDSIGGHECPAVEHHVVVVAGAGQTLVVQTGFPCQLRQLGAHCFVVGNFPARDELAILSGDEHGFGLSDKLAERQRRVDTCPFEQGGMAQIPLRSEG